MEHNGISGKYTSGVHRSCWLDSVPAFDEKKLTGNKTTDVVIVGAGLGGMTTAYCLLKSGKRVIVVDDGVPGSGETGRTTAQLVTALDDRYYHYQSVFGKEEATMIAKSHADAIDFVEQVTLQENISCDFKRVDGYLFSHPTDEADNLAKELEAARQCGLPVTMVNEIPGISHAKNAIRFEKQAQFHPLKYLLGLQDAIKKMGGEIYTNTHAKEISGKGIQTNDGFSIQAGHVVVATNSPVNNLVVMHLKQFAYRTYVIASLIPKNSLPQAFWWDTGDHEVNKNIPPYHYVRTQPWTDLFDLLIIGGEDHAVGLADAKDIPEEERYARLESWAKKHFNMGEILYRWSGQVLEPADSLGFLGRNPWDDDNVFIITGDSGNGMTHCTIGAMLITDLINGKENKLERIYNPGRIRIKAGNVMFSELVEGMISYLKSKPKDADAVKINDIRMGEGKVVEIRKEKYGVYRDDENILHVVSVDCTHLGCTVKWNNDEKSWDCPCHGSRFTFDGEVLNGPANTPLPCYNEREIIGREH